jgi:archaemetzincin
MKIGVLGIGQIESQVLTKVAHGLAEILPETACEYIGDVLAAPEIAYDKKRLQYNSTMILGDIKAYASHRQEYNRLLGIIDADIYSSDLNYVFGEAFIGGNAALISLWRLKPEF